MGKRAKPRQPSNSEKPWLDERSVAEAEADRRRAELEADAADAEAQGWYQYATEKEIEEKQAAEDDHYLRKEEDRD